MAAANTIPAEFIQPVETARTAFAAGDYDEAARAVDDILSCRLAEDGSRRYLSTTKVAKWTGLREKMVRELDHLAWALENDDEEYQARARRCIEDTIRKGAPKERNWVMRVAPSSRSGISGEEHWYLVRAKSECTARTKVCRALGIKWHGHSIGGYVADGPTGLQYVDKAMPLGELAEGTVN
jgi:hypothetical protein